ncbi:retinol-binding protein pinta-like [Photinus pyralis]|nr:retinol-binding protein pinta-like [Photinus pyralis]
MVYRTLSVPLQRKAIEELNEDPPMIDECLLGIREWIEKQPHLKVKSDDDSLLVFLRGCKWSLERVKEKLDHFYTVRTLIPEFFSDRDPLTEDIQTLLNRGVMLPLPNTNGSDGPRICYFNFECVDLDLPKIVPSKYFFMILDALLEEDDHLIVSGIEIIINMKGLPASYLMQFTPTLAMQSIHCLQSAYPLRVRRILLINAMPAIEKVFSAIFMPFFGKKIKDRIQVFSAKNIEEAYEYIPKSFFPIELDGANGSCVKLTEKWKNKIENKRQYFLEEEMYRNNELIRQGEPKTTSDVFGVVGSFRKLSVD